MPKKKNYETIRYGNKDGEIKFGHIHNDEVLSAYMVRSGYDFRHYTTMDADGKRKGWTTNKCPAVYQIECGEDVDSKKVSLYIHAIKGDIVLKASDGNIRLQAAGNIDILANGHDNKNGNITIESNEKVEIKSKNIECTATSVAKFFSSGTCKVVGDSMLDIYGGLAACATGASKLNKSKYSTEPEKENNSFLA
jgi:hypothetical protein